MDSVHHAQWHAKPPRFLVGEVAGSVRHAGRHGSPLLFLVEGVEDLEGVH